YHESYTPLGDVQEVHRGSPLRQSASSADKSHRHLQNFAAVSGEERARELQVCLGVRHRIVGGRAFEHDPAVIADLAHGGDTGGEIDVALSEHRVGMISFAVLEVNLGEDAGLAVGADLVGRVHAPPHRVRDVEVDPHGAGADLLQQPE